MAIMLTKDQRQALRARRQTLGKSLGDVGREVGLTAQFIGLVETGTTRVSVENLGKIVDCLKLPRSAWLPGEVDVDAAQLGQALLRDFASAAWPPGTDSAAITLEAARAAARQLYVSFVTQVDGTDPATVVVDESFIERLAVGMMHFMARPGPPK